MRQISLLLWSWIETCRNLGRAQLWAPFLCFALIQSLTVLLFTQFHQPGLSGFLVPLLRALGGDAVLQYPAFYVALPAIFSRASLVLSLVFGSWLYGAAFLCFWQADRPTEQGSGAFARATKGWGKLLLARLPVAVALLLLVYMLPQALTSGSASLSATALRSIRFGTIALASVVEALFLYAPLAILVEGLGIGKAIGRSFVLAVRMPIATLFAVLIPNLVQIPIAYVLRNSETIVMRLSPEMVAWSVIIGIVLFTVATFFIVGAGARLFRVQTEDAID